MRNKFEFVLKRKDPDPGFIFFLFGSEDPDPYQNKMDPKPCL